MNKDKRLKLFLQCEKCICKRHSFTKILQLKEITERSIYIDREVLDKDELPPKKLKKKVAELK